MTQRAEHLLSIVSKVASGLSLMGIVWILTSISTMNGRLIVIETLTKANRNDHDNLIRLEQSHRALVLRVGNLERSK